MEYIHIWKYKDSGELCKLEGRVAESLEQAIEDYRQEENPAVIYEETLIIGLSSVMRIDIRDEIEARAYEELPDYIKKYRADMQRGFDDARERI